MGATVRLGDGQSRHLLAYRVLGPWEVETKMDLASIPIPGFYLAEVVCEEKVQTEWTFDS